MQVYPNPNDGDFIVKFNLKKAEPAPPPPGPTKDQELLGEIRDLLKK